MRLSVPLPRLPLVPDPLRRARVPRDLEAVTEHAFGHLGFTNIVGWADPEHSLSGALITSRKPVLHPEIAEFWNAMRVIAGETPKVAV